ncbi:hypothetical protein VNO77_27679 [Canavalia gladiata]|uniref:AMP-dependent synthetase/ligase domain-containing protein n=1 Tax=Canavalia gladiata TaxID=3824 RepID=A0AAN9Q6Q3_CANGL
MLGLKGSHVEQRKLIMHGRGVKWEMIALAPENVQERIPRSRLAEARIAFNSVTNKSVSYDDLRKSIDSPASALFLGLDIIKMYASVEQSPVYGLIGVSAPATFFTSNEDVKAYLHSYGKLIPNFYAKVIDIEGGKPLPPCKEGGLWFKSLTIMKGYLGNLQLTNATVDLEGASFRTRDCVVQSSLYSSCNSYTVASYKKLRRVNFIDTIPRIWAKRREESPHHIVKSESNLVTQKSVVKHLMDLIKPAARMVDKVFKHGAPRRSYATFSSIITIRKPKGQRKGVSCDLFNGLWEKVADSLQPLEIRSNLGLIGSIPSCFAALKNLQSLVLLENVVTGEIPPDIRNLIKLKKFPDVDDNYLEGYLLNECANLKNVTLMDLRNNRFSGGLTLSFQEMHFLEEMVLSNSCE